jgi:hypothetical protein
LAEAESRLKQYLARVEEECERCRRAGDRHSYRMARGAIRMSRARLEWVREVIDELGGSGPSSGAGPGVVHLG